MMSERFGDIWALDKMDPPIDDVDAICVTINGFVKSDGSAVMGRGCALEAATKFPDITFKLGAELTLDNAAGRWRGIYDTGIRHTYNSAGKDALILGILVKPKTAVVREDGGNVVPHMKGKLKPGTQVPGWMVMADVEIIRNSVMALVAMCKEREWKRVVLPRPGCGAGQLVWEGEVKAGVDRLFGKSQTEFIIVNH